MLGVRQTRTDISGAPTGRWSSVSYETLENLRMTEQKDMEKDD